MQTTVVELEFVRVVNFDLGVALLALAIVAAVIFAGIFFIRRRAASRRSN